VIYLLFTDAVEKAKNHPDVKKLMKEGYFLGSVFATAQESIKEWILHFYSSKKNKIIDCTVVDDREEVIISEETDPINKPNKLELDNVKISPDQVLETAKQHFKSSTVNILLTLHENGGRAVWTVNMISPGMTATTYDIDSSSGEIINEKVTNLITRYSKAS